MRQIPLVAKHAQYTGMSAPEQFILYLLLTHLLFYLLQSFDTANTKAHSSRPTRDLNQNPKSNSLLWTSSSLSESHGRTAKETWLGTNLAPPDTFLRIRLLFWAYFFEIDLPC